MIMATISEVVGVVGVIVVVMLLSYSSVLLSMI